MIWVSGDEGTASNETADQLAKLASECTFTGPEATCVSQRELPIKGSGTGKTETIRNTGIP
jgi:hypothetical protein